MKGQVSIEALASLLAFAVIIWMMCGSLNGAASGLKKGTLEFGNKMKSDEITAYCNLVYMKGMSSLIGIFPDMSSASGSDCFSESYYYNTKNPKANSSRRWF